MASSQDHAHHAHGIRQRRDETRLQVGQAERLDDLRQEETQTVVGRVRTEVDQCDGEHARIEQRFLDAERMLRFTMRALVRLT